MVEGRQRDHGGGLDRAVKTYGGVRSDWLDLSTGINPTPYLCPDIPQHFWTDLPDSAAQAGLLNAARAFWSVPEGADIIAAPGVSALIAQLPRLGKTGSAGVYRPSYNEHEASFVNHGWDVASHGDANVYVHPNNPDGRLFTAQEICDRHGSLSIIDESFCDVTPDKTLISLAAKPGFVVLKGLGKFWGLAGLRLGFAIAASETVDQLKAMLGPWAISGPAQHIGAAALSDVAWAGATRSNLAHDRKRLDAILVNAGLALEGGTDLFGLYHAENAGALQVKLAQRHIWTRVFPYSETLIRFGLPGLESDWNRLEQAVDGT